jgi:hypothetical protein
MTMSDYSSRRISAQRRVTNLVNRVAFTGFLVFLLVVIVVELFVDDPDKSGTGHAFEVVAGWSAIVAFVVGLVCAAVGAIVFPSHGYWSPRDNPLPGWGWWGRVAARIGIRLLWVTIGASFLTLVPAVIDHYVHVLPDSWNGDLLGEVVSVVVLIAVLLMGASGLVWFAAEMVTRWRRGRSQRASGGPPDR